MLVGYWAPGRSPDNPLYRPHQIICMNGEGSQKAARLHRLKNEIIEYVTKHPGCSAADIVDHLSNTLRMRNHGLTARKVGFFIPRYLKHTVMFNLDSSTGKRIYSVA